MPRYKPDRSDQLQFVPVDFARQIVPGTFEHALSHLINDKVDLAAFDARYRNDQMGATAYDPRLLLKIVLLGYSRGLLSSRRIEAACQENVVFMAISGGVMPNFTTIASFVSETAPAIRVLFTQVLMVCHDVGLIGREHFAIDGVKLPSNASKAWSGRRKDLHKKLRKCEKAAAVIIARHQQQDKAEADRSDDDDRDARALKRLEGSIDKLQAWLPKHKEVPSKRGYVRQQNITDPDSAKMKTSHGTIQGYAGIALVDDRHQVIVEAEAFGDRQEQGTLVPMLDGLEQQLAAMGDSIEGKQLTADAGFHSEANVKAVYERGIDGYIADNEFRKRDPRFADAEQHEDPRERRQRSKQRAEAEADACFGQDAFTYDAIAQTCICPAGERLTGPWPVSPGGKEGVGFHGRKSLCGPCPMRAKCLRHPEKKDAYRQIVFFSGRTIDPKYAPRMKEKIDSEHGRRMYGRRLATVEPVFGHMRTHKRMDRFTLRSKIKVNAQWLMYCLVHNITKLQRFGFNQG